MAPNRNAPCPCGSGKKIKKCCGVDGLKVRGNQPTLPPLEAYESNTTTKGPRISEMSTADIIEWASPPANLKETQDPGAQEYLEAHQLFMQGIRCAQNGDLDQGEVLIASAFCLDDRVMKAWPKPEPMPDGVPMLDYELLVDMLSAPQDPRNPSYAHQFFHVILPFWFGSRNLEEREELNMVQKALGVIDDFLRLLKHEPHLEGDGESGVFGGLFRSARFHMLKAHLSERMGNSKQVVRSFTDVLASNPKGTEHEARLLRAMKWGVQKAKTDKELYDEFKQWISVSHPDSRHMFGACAWLALLTFRDYQCGTYEDGVEWLKKAKAAKERNEYLYANPQDDTDAKTPPVWRLALKSYPVRDGGLGGREIEEIVRVRREVDRHVAEGTLPNLQDLEGRLERVTIDRDAEEEDPGREIKPLCLKCGAESPKDGGPKLLRCACKAVYYCSKVCQTEHWPNHKKQCKMAREDNQRHKKAEKERGYVPLHERGGDVEEETYGVCLQCPPGEDDEGTKASVELNKRCSTGECPCGGAHAQIQKCQRMEARVKEDLEKHGSHLAKWWHDKSMSERENALRCVTDNLPSKPLTPKDVKRKAVKNLSGAGIDNNLSGAGQSLLLSEYSVEYLSGKCFCWKLPEEEKLGHPHDDMLIHELWSRGVDVEDTEYFDYNCAKVLCHSTQAVPGFYNGSLATYQNQNPDESIYDVLGGEQQVMVVTDRADANALAMINSMLKKGFMLEASALKYALVRRSISLMLLTKLVELFHERERRAPVRHEFGRLNGCDTCDGHCDGDRASCCKECMAQWWCSAACRRASSHHNRCPLKEHGGREAVMCVGFAE
jgi:hypothetical protein